MAGHKRKVTRRIARYVTGALAGLSAALALSSNAAAGPKDGYFTGSDLLCLALNVYQEARNQPAEGQLAVAHVTLNRLEEARFPTICDVVFKSGYFSWTKDPRKLKQDPTDRKAWERAQRIARQALADPKDDPVNGSTYFHTTAIAPGWAPAMVRVARIGDHVFYRPATSSPQ
jgi:N-acetylmuramoyl-L-alanine amidase